MQTLELPLENGVSAESSQQITDYDIFDEEEVETSKTTLSTRQLLETGLQRKVKDDLNDDIRKPSGANFSDELILYVENIKRHRVKNNINKFLIRWQEYPAKGNTWETESRLSKELVKQSFLSRKLP